MEKDQNSQRPFSMVPCAIAAVTHKKQIVQATDGRALQAE